MCMKGLKGSNYGPVIKWYKNMEDNTQIGKIWNLTPQNKVLSRHFYAPRVWC